MFIDIKQTPKKKAISVGLLVLASMLVLLWGALRSPGLAVDDAFITYRYAKNFSQGQGLVYNPGEWVLGTTTPFYALLLGICGLVIPDLVLVGHWLGIVFWIGAIWCAWLFFERERLPKIALAAALLLAFEPTLLSNLGMETPLVVFLMFATAWTWFGGRRILFAFLAAALLLTRQDTALWLMFLGIAVWLKENRLPWRESVFAVLLTVPWFAYAWWQYGAALPNSAAAKIGQAQGMHIADQIPFWRAFGQPLTALPLPLTIIALILVFIALWAIFGRQKNMWWLPAWLVTYIGVYSWLQVVNFGWYFIPPLTVFRLITAVGLGVIAGENGLWSNRWQRPAGIVAGGLLLLLLGATVPSLWRNTTVRGHQAAYPAVAAWLEDHTPTTATVAAIEIGVIGYYSERPILDTMGLVSADMTTHQVGWVETVVYALTVYQPDYALALPGTAWDFVQDKWWFRDRYAPVAVVEGVTIFERREKVSDELSLPVGLTYENGLTISALQLISSDLEAGRPFDIGVELEVTAAQGANYQITTYLVDTQTSAWLGVTSVTPFDGGYPSQAWQPGDKLTVPVRMQIPADLAPGGYRLGAFLYDPQFSAPLPVAGIPENDTALPAGWLRWGLPEQADLPTPASLAEDVIWDGPFTLRGLQFPAAAVPGESLPVEMLWQIGRRVERDLTLFVHLIDEQGQIMVQVDQRPFQGLWPLPVWQSGESFQETRYLTLPLELPNDLFRLRIGWYDQAGVWPLVDGSEYWVAPQPIQISAEP